MKREVCDSFQRISTTPVNTYVQRGETSFDASLWLESVGVSALVLPLNVCYSRRRNS